jgi:hypothetical protein
VPGGHLCALSQPEAVAGALLAGIKPHIALPEADRGRPARSCSADTRSTSIALPESRRARTAG